MTPEPPSPATHHWGTYPGVIDARNGELDDHELQLLKAWIDQRTAELLASASRAS